MSNWYTESVAATDDERQTIESFVNDLERSILKQAMATQPTNGEQNGTDTPPTNG